MAQKFIKVVYIRVCPDRMSHVDTSSRQALPPYYHGRASAPSMVHGFRPPRGGSTAPSPRLSPGLPRLAASRPHSGDNNSSSKLVLLHESVIVPSRAVAQSMVTMSTSCPDLTKGRQRSPLEAAGADGTSSSSKAGAATGAPPTGLVRCRVPLSMASASSPRLARRTSGYLTARQSTAGDTPPGDTPPSSSTPDQVVESTGESLGPLRRRPGTQESRQSYSSGSPANTPVTHRRRRAGQFSLTAPNDVLAQARAGTGDAPSPSTDQPSHRTSTVSQLSSKDQQGHTSSSRQPNTARQQGPHSNQTVHKKMSSTPSPESKLRHPSKDVQGGSTNNKPAEGSQANKASSDSVQNPSTVEETEEDLTNGMAPETYERCVRWIIDVESAKGKRPLEAIILPPVKIVES